MSQHDEHKWPHPYERPNQKWICGRSETGLPCRLGPDQRGACRTTAECAPVLDRKPGEEKGHYRCTRPAEYGGPCSEGPLPSGACGHSLPPCAPIRSWRYRRAIFTWWIVGLTTATLLFLLSGPLRFRFTNPGPVSFAHSQPRAGLKSDHKAGEENCAACHRSAGDGFSSWVSSAGGATPGLFHFAAFSGQPSFNSTSMDRACSECHRGHNFHHSAGIAENVSCVSCHTEHQGDTGLHLRSSSECSRCHGNSDYLRNHARATGSTLSGLVNSFSKDHPEFDVLASGARDTNTLRFNHALHLSPEIAGADGSQLQCSSCHQRDAAGAYHQPINFQRHCQSCHSLQFDSANPEMHLPHGDVKFVQAFLASLPEQYERFGREGRNITERRALAAFVESNMRRFQQAQLGGEDLRQKVFFNRDRTAAGARVSNLPASGAASFYGCAYCHETSGTTTAPVVIAPSVPARWLARGSFNHFSHQSISCESCHQVGQSRSTADILLPGVKSCAMCHNANSAPGESCVVCHDYHRKVAIP